MPSPLNDPELEALLDRLHSASTAQETEIREYFEERVADGTLDRRSFDAEAERFFADKMVALDRDKAELCYLLCRALRAERVVEAGTSYGVSTLYLAAAVRDNGADGGVVIGTELEPEKAAAARRNFQEAGLADFVDLREGDLRDTLGDVGGPVDFMLVDIWNVAFPALELVSPHLRSGAIVVCDNTSSFRDAYDEYFAFVNDPANRLRTLTLPFAGGLEITVKV